MPTEENLKKAFSGESQANRRYLSFSDKAKFEGYPQIAKLFKAAANAEAVHARSHLRVLKAIKTTGENLKEAISGENFEHTKMYPGYIGEAEFEKNRNAVLSFRNANAVEQIHEELFKAALEFLENGEDFEESEIFVCQICGNTVFDEPPKVCPICNNPKENFNKIDL